MIVAIKGIVYDINENNKTGCVKYSDCMIQFAKILEKVQGCIIKEIDSRAFYHCEKLKKVFIPNTIKKIKNESFSGCVKLSSINGNNNIEAENIGFYAFKDCHSLPSIKFPNLITLGKGAFENCKNLLFVYFPNTGFYVLEENIFVNCVSLKEFTFTKCIVNAKDNFKGCSNLKIINFENATLNPEPFILNLNKEEIILYGEDGYDAQRMAMYGYKFIRNKYRHIVT